MNQMPLNRRTLSYMLIGAGACLLDGPAVARLFAQEQAPNRREFTIKASEYRFAPDRIEVTQDDLVKLTVRSEDVAYGFTIDHYRVSKRIPAGGAVSLEFRADASGTYAYYSNMTSDPRHGSMKGELVVKSK